MYRVRRIGWQTLLITDEEGIAIGTGLLAAWRRLGLAFVTPQNQKPSVVVIGFGMDNDTRETAGPLMRQMIALLPGEVRYFDANDREMTEPAWYE